MSNTIRKTGRKALSVFLSATTGLWLTGGAFLMPVAANAQAMTIAEMQALIATLTAQLAALTGGSTSGGSSAAKCTFTRALTLNVTGDDVMCLQKYLNGAGFQVSASGAGSPGNETSFFGSRTQSAVSAWQTANGVSPTAGYFGAISQAKYNALMASSGGTTGGGTTGGGTTPITGTVTVTAGSQPAATVVPRSAARVPFTRIVVTNGSSAEITLNSVLVERTGTSQNSDLGGVVLLDESGTQIGDSKTLGSNSTATVGSATKIGAGQSKTFTIGGNISSTAGASNIAFLAVQGVNLSGGATVSGTFPIIGAGHQFTATSLIGTITNARGPLDPNGAQSKPVGTTGYTFSSIRVTAGSAEKVRLNSIRWNQSGSASASDLANVKILVEGTEYPATVSSDGKYYTAVFPGGILIEKGLAKEISIKGDIVGGTSRTIAFDLYKTTDLNVSGETYGYGITPPTSGTGFASTNPWYDASVVTVTAGTANTIAKSNASPLNNAQNIAVLAPNQPLGGFEVEIKGEPTSVTQMVFNITATGDEAENITNISLVDQNGTVLAGPVDGASTATDSAWGTVTFTDTVEFPVGKTIITLKGQLGSAFATNDTVQASTTPSSQWSNPKGVNTGDTVSLSSFSSAITGNLMTVKAGALAISVSTQPTARTVIAGAQGFTFANYILDAGQSGEDVKLSSFIASTSLVTVTASQLQNCDLYDGTTNVTNNTSVTLAVGNNTFTFNGGGLTVPKGTQKTLAMKCDLSGGATSGTIWWGLDGGASFSGATSVGSGQEVSETMTTALGQAMTVATGGSYTVTEDTSLRYAAAQAGTSGVTLGKFRFTAGASEGVDLQQIALQLSNTASNSPADLQNLQVSLWNGSQQIGTAQFGGANADFATSTILSPAPRIAAGESLVITVKGDLAPQNVNEGTPGAFLVVSYDGNNSSGTQGNYAKGVDSQSNIAGGTTSDVDPDGLRIFRTVPSIAVTSNSHSNLGVGADLYKFVVTNPNSRDVVFQKFTMSIATSGASTNGFILYGDGIAFNNSTSTVNAETFIELISTGTSEAQIVPANSSKTYILKASTATDGSSTESITLALLADTSYPACASLMCTVTLVEAGNAATDNIIWSPFSTTTPVATAATQSNLDWTNGYGMPGFPSNADFSVQSFTRPQ